MQPDVKTYNLPARADCLGCADCKGFCQDLLDLAFLPETVLRAVNRSR